MKKLSDINPPVLWFWAFVTIMLGLSFLFGPAQKRMNLYEVRFTTTYSSLLYFKNIRSFYYDIDESRKPFVLYRLKENKVHWDSRSPVFTIVSNPLGDEAYIYIESGDTLKQSPLETVL